MKKLNYFLLSIALFFSFTIDDDFLKKIIVQLDKYNTEFPQEKAYLHLDKPYYTAGETIWVKAYLVEAMTNLPDTVSVPLYIELIDNQAGSIVDKKIVKLEAGFGEADFLLADSLRAGYYSLRAYTQWMKNFDEDFMFSKEFKVHQIGNEEAQIKGNAQNIDFQFFPEGGDLVEGISSRLAFKAVDVLGNSLAINGIITTEKGDTVMQFESVHHGMGVFNFKPEANEKYFCKIKYRNIYEKDILFPEIKKEGVVLGVQNLWGKDQIRLFVTHNSKTTEGNLYIVGQSRGHITYGAKAPLAKKSVFMNVPKSNFQNGVVQFTVFDENGMPQCERVIFLENAKPLTVSILTNKKTYKPREKVSLEIEAKDHEGKPVMGNFSLAVSDGKQILEKPFDENIQTYLLLSSDLKGKIEQPAYYFDKNNPNVNAHLDLLMLTQGWRRFRWENVQKAELPTPRYFLERGLTISGEVHRQNGKLFEKPVNITMMLAHKDSTRQFGMAECDKTGAFSFVDLNYIDSAKVMIQAVAGKENRNTKITINKLISPQIRTMKIPFNAIEFDENELAAYLKYTKEILEFEKKLRLDKIQMLNEIVVKAKRKPEEQDSRMIYSYADASVKIDDMNSAGAFSIFDVLRGRVAGVMISGSMNDPQVVIRGMSSLMGSSEPLFVLDGMPVDKETMMSLSVRDVEKIDILKGGSAAIFGSRGGAGVISVLTKRGNPNYNWSNDDSVMGINVMAVAGYSLRREFYSPKYDVSIPENLRPDFRSTVFWKPSIKTDANGKAKVEFFNTDAETTMKVSVEGLSYSGQPVATKMSYEVKK